MNLPNERYKEKINKIIPGTNKEDNINKGITISSTKATPVMGNKKNSLFSKNKGVLGWPVHKISSSLDK